MLHKSRYAPADRYQKTFAQAQQSGSLAKATAVNAKLMQTERVFLLPNGLPNRDWFKHQIYAPGFYTGYGVKTIPAVREAIEHNDYDLASSAIESVGKVLESEAAAIDAATAELK